MARKRVAEPDAVARPEHGPGTKSWPAPRACGVRRCLRSSRRRFVMPAIALLTLLALSGLLADGASARLAYQRHASARLARHQRHQRDLRRLRRERRLVLHAASDGAPSLWLTSGVLHWSATATSHEYLESRTAGETTTYAVVVGTSDTPPLDAGATVTYQVRPRYRPRAWSNEVKISYPGGRPPRTHEGGHEHEEPNAREREEREAREREAREAKERAEREAKEKAEREAKEKAEREAREKAERERREREEREKGGTGGAVAPSAPPGVPVPSSGWHVAYADAFGAPLSTDRTITPRERGQGCCGNSNEVNVTQTSQVRVGPEGLEEVCQKVPGGVTVEGVRHEYTCGAAETDPSFSFADGLVGEWAVEIVAKWPACEGGADPGFWVYPSESTEIDFFEGWCWPSGTYRAATSWATAEAGIPVLVGQGRHEAFPVSLGLGFEPSLAVHRYTTVFIPEGGGRYDAQEFIDGWMRWQIPGQTMTSIYDGLILSDGLREHGQADDFVVRSIEVFQDGAHAGQGVHGGGIAPGTTLE